MSSISFREVCDDDCACVQRWAQSCSWCGDRGASQTGYHVAFRIGAGLIAAAHVAILVLVTAGKDDTTTQPGVPADA